MTRNPNILSIENPVESEVLLTIEESSTWLLDSGVGRGEAASAEEITHQSVSVEEPAYRRYETRQNTHREREREAQRMSIFIYKATVTK